MARKKTGSDATIEIVKKRPQKQLEAGSWIEGSHLEYSTIILFIYCWSQEYTTIAFVQKELEIGSVETIVAWNSYLREVCAQKLLENPVKIDSEGKTVEIDESVFARVKYNRGRKCKEQWVFGEICSETKE